MLTEKEFIPVVKQDTERQNAFGYAAFCVRRGEPIKVDVLKRLLPEIRLNITELFELKTLCRMNQKQHPDDIDSLGAKLSLVLVNRKLENTLKEKSFSN